MANNNKQNVNVEQLKNALTQIDSTIEQIENLKSTIGTIKEDILANLNLPQWKIDEFKKMVKGFNLIESKLVDLSADAQKGIINADDEDEEEDGE